VPARKPRTPKAAPKMETAAPMAPPPTPIN
jgi:hypothetical protein